MTDAWGRDLVECPHCGTPANLTKGEVLGWMQRHLEASADCAEKNAQRMMQKAPSK